MYRSLLLPIIALLLLGSCRDKDSNNAAPAAGIWGSMIVQHTTSDSDFIYPGLDDAITIATFYARPDAVDAPLVIDSVLVNDFDLSDNGDTTYIGEPGPGYQTSVTWKVAGGAKVPSFTHTDVSNYPDYHGPALPDTLDPANGFSMSFPASTYSSGDTVAIWFNQYSLTGAATVYKTMDANHNITFSPQELAGLYRNDLNFASLIITNVKYETFGGKRFYFGKERIYLSNVFVR